MSEPADYPHHHLFHHEAMKTTFSLRLCGESEETARGMAHECFEEIDALENKLSRFIEGSDVQRINTMKAGETLYLSEPCYECLLLAMQAYAETAGLFDVTLGTLIEHRKSEESVPVPALEGKLVVHPDVPAVTCESPGREIDLGGIGKGFALDRLKMLLLEWGSSGALLSSGASTLLAFGPEAWPIDLAGSGDALRIGLRDEALSASGTGIQGSHIVHPDGAGESTEYPYPRIWVIGTTAAHADAWSTAVMLMSPDEICDALAAAGSLRRVFADRGERVEEVSDPRTPSS